MNKIYKLAEKEIPDADEVEYKWVPTTNYHYSYDTEDSLYGIIELEFGFRDTFPHNVAQHCLSLQKKYQCGSKSALWLGSGAGRGPLELTNVFQNVNLVKANLNNITVVMLITCVIHVLQ